MKLSKKLENLFSATAFAEEGEFETARQMVAENAEPGKTRVTVKDVNLATPQIKPGPMAPEA